MGSVPRARRPCPRGDSAEGTGGRIYLQTDVRAVALALRAAATDGIARIVCVSRDGETVVEALEPGVRTLETSLPPPFADADDFVYVRVESTTGEMAWSSPAWQDEINV